MFEIGDRVQVPTCVGNYCLRDQYGTIIGNHESSSDEYLIEFDNDIGGHDGYEFGTRKGKDRHCWYVYADNLVLINRLQSEDLLKILEAQV